MTRVILCRDDGDNRNASTEGSPMMVESDLHFDGEEESVKRFTRDTVDRCWKLRNFYVRAVLGLTRKSPSENDTEETSRSEKERNRGGYVYACRSFRRVRFE